MGVTATFDSNKIAGKLIPVSEATSILYPFPACTERLTPNDFKSVSDQAPVATTTSSAVSISLSVLTLIIREPFF